MAMINSEFDRIHVSLKEQKIMLNSIYDHKSKFFDYTKVVKMSREIDDILISYIDTIKSMEQDELSNAESSNLSPEAISKDKSYYRFFLQSLKCDVEEVCILITFLLYGLKDCGSINDEEYKEYTYYKKQIFERNHQQTIKDLIVFLEL